MEITEFIENFADQFDDVEASALNAETRFRDLDEWSSLIALSVICMIDDEYDVEMKGAELSALNTIGEVYNYVNSKLG